ncbi:hypothetical protein SLEP1_g34954 [Rubroshorea leprosula]|uniref:Uncharacterized protein n=1 Tax=Rubroshorea leprosula TaxID=152421 RepID=A0AAV5KLN8_9ROSI|nr:hypothetical protein SLEP1_g34954 [Rubroshorea leprosula]
MIKFIPLLCAISSLKSSGQDEDQLVPPNTAKSNVYLSSSMEKASKDEFGFLVGEVSSLMRTCVLEDVEMLF